MSWNIVNFRKSVEQNVNKLSTARRTAFQNTVIGLVEQMLVSTNKSTAYSSKKAIQEAAANTVESIMEVNRDLLLLLLSMDSQYFMKQVGMNSLVRYTREDTTIVDGALEADIINRWLHFMPVTAVLRFFHSFTGVGSPNAKEVRKNSSKLRKMFLRYFFSQPADVMVNWSLKYRSKLQDILKHLYGIKKYRALYNITQVPYSGFRSRTQQMRTINLVNTFSKYSDNAAISFECIAFIIEPNRRVFTNRRLKAFTSAKTNVAELAKLPTEVAWGIAQTYHPHLDEPAVIAMTSRNMSKKEQGRRSSTSAGQIAQLSQNLNSFSSKQLYLKGFEQGVSEEMITVLTAKARSNARKGNITTTPKTGILLDTSRSMMGKGDAKFHAMAIGLTVRDMLLVTAKDKGHQVVLETTSTSTSSLGHLDFVGRLPYVSGSTSMTTALLDLVEAGCDSIYVITDGYENSEGNLFSEVVIKLRNAGINIPIYQYSVVVGAEVGAARQLSEVVPNIPINDPAKIKTQMILQTLKTNFVEGVQLLFAEYAPLMLNK